MKIYCSGIGGIGLSAYAALQNAAGHTVLGSDRTQTPLTDDLESQGITVVFTQDGSGVPEDLDLFVYSEAIPETAPERVRAKELGVRQIPYAGGLGEISDGSRTVAVCGTHGKSSTTAMVARVLLELEQDPSIVVGTKLKELDGRNWRCGQSGLFALEACEYRRSFHNLHPNIILLTNCDGDHFDAFENVEVYQQAYRDFIKLLPDDGVVITHLSDPDCQAVLEGFDGKVVDADSFPLIEMKTPGSHMQANGQLVLALAQELGLDADLAKQALAGYSGCWRRMEIKGEWRDGITVIDDYGHHPLEVKAVLAALKDAYPDRQNICLFQPHTHNRTLALYQEFAESFSDADQVAVLDVYDARADTESELVDVQDFTNAIADASKVPALHTGDLEQTKAWLEANTPDSSVVLCLGAGTITNLATELTKE